MFTARNKDAAVLLIYATAFHSDTQVPYTIISIGKTDYAIKTSSLSSKLASPIVWMHMCLVLILVMRKLGMIWKW